jgi:hypothetical protein
MIGRKEVVLPVLASLIALTWYMLQPYSKYPRWRYKTVLNYLPRRRSLDISFKDDVTVILLLFVSFMFVP